MPPKARITKEQILSAAVDLVRKSGADALNARTLASLLACSTQPIFSNFSSMEELRLAVVGKADTVCSEYIQREIESGKYPVYKASGMAYIRFAKEERELFKLLYMRDRAGETESDQPTKNTQMESVVHRNTGLSDAETKLFHFEMWAFVHGIAAMFATGFLDLDWDTVSGMLTDAYQGLRKQYGVE